jgi:hypothetical protein
VVAAGLAALALIVGVVAFVTLRGDDAARDVPNSASAASEPPDAPRGEAMAAQSAAEDAIDAPAQPPSATPSASVASAPQAPPEPPAPRRPLGGIKQKVKDAIKPGYQPKPGDDLFN